MATPVPYEGAPRVDPRLEPTPSVSVNTPPAAFGVNVAEAISHLGQVNENAGKELFDRAYAMQELNLHAQVNARLADAGNRMMDRSVQYNNLEGNAAVEGLQSYHNDLDSIRNAGAQGLPPMGVEFYDTESRNLRNRIAWQGTEHAAGEQKKYIVGSANARIASLETEAELDPDNPAANAARLAQIKDQIVFKNHTVSGLKEGDPQWDMNIKEGVSAFYGANIRGLAEKDPFKAQKLLEEGIADKSLLPGVVDAYGRNSIQRLQDFVDNKLHTIGGRVVTTEAMSGQGFKFGGGILSDSQLLAGLKGSEGGTYNFKGPTVTDKAGNTGYALGHYGVMSYNLASWLSEAGMPAMSEDQFRASPDVQDRLAVFKMQQYQQKYGSANAAAIAWFGGEGAAQAFLNEPGYLARLKDINMNGFQYLSNFNHGLAQTSSLRDVRAVGAQIAEEHVPGDALFADAVDKNISLEWERNQTQLHNDEFNTKQTIDQAILTGGPNGQMFSTVDELANSSPAVKEAWDNLLPSDRLGYISKLATFAKGDVYMTTDRLRTYQDLVGEASHDPEKFLKEDILSKDLPISAKKELINKQQQVFKHEDADPNISRALRIPGIADQLQDLNLVKGGDESNLNLFSAALGDEMKMFSQENGRPPKQEETEAIATKLLQGVATQNGLFSIFNESRKPFFEGEAPYDWAVNARFLAQKSLGYTPTDQEVQRWWIQLQYQKQYGKSVSAPDASK